MTGNDHVEMKAKKNQNFERKSEIYSKALGMSKANLYYYFNKESGGTTSIFTVPLIALGVIPQMTVILVRCVVSSFNKNLRLGKS